jgi:predicted nucleotidyltransferase
MDDYLKSFVQYLQNEFGDNLAGVIIFGSYGKPNFDLLKSDYDVFVLFKDEVIDIREEIIRKFPRIVLHVYMNLEHLKNKILTGGWNTYIAFVFTGKVLYITQELEQLKKQISQFKPNIKNLSAKQKTALVEKLKADTKNANDRDGYILNKFLYASLLRKLQILYFLRRNEIILEFNTLIGKFEDKFVSENSEWLRKVEKMVFERNEKLVSTKPKYIRILEEADLAIEKELSYLNIK